MRRRDPLVLGLKLLSAEVGGKGTVGLKEFGGWGVRPRKQPGAVEGPG